MQKISMMDQTTDPSAPFSAKILLKLGTKFLTANLHSLSKIYRITMAANYINQMNTFIINEIIESVSTNVELPEAPLT